MEQKQEQETDDAHQQCLASISKLLETLEEESEEFRKISFEGPDWTSFFLIYAQVHSWVHLDSSNVDEDLPCIVPTSKDRWTLDPTQSSLFKADFELVFTWNRPVRECSCLPEEANWTS